MLAGELLSAGRFERFDFDGARQHFLVAQRHSEPASFPHMLALHARAYTFEQQGQPKKARQLYVRIKEEYLALHATSIYQQVRRQVTDAPTR